MRRRLGEALSNAAYVDEDSDDCDYAAVDDTWLADAEARLDLDTQWVPAVPSAGGGGIGSRYSMRCKAAEMSTASCATDALVLNVAVIDLEAPACT